MTSLAFDIPAASSRPARTVAGTPLTVLDVLRHPVLDVLNLDTVTRYQVRRPSRDDLEGRFRCPCDQLCDQQARKSASSVPSAWAMSPAIISAAARSWPVDLWVQRSAV